MICQERSVTGYSALTRVRRTTQYAVRILNAAIDPGLRLRRGEDGVRRAYLPES